MNTIKVGDRVRVGKKADCSDIPTIEFDNRYGEKYGVVTKIHDISKASFPYVVQLDGNNYNSSFNVNEIILLPEEVVMNKIKVGDRVSICGDIYPNLAYKGKRGFVIVICKENGFPYVVRMDNTNHQVCFRVQELILLPENEVVVNKIKVGDRVIAGEQASCSDMLPKHYDAGYKGKSGVVKGIFEDLSMRFPYRVELDGNNYNSHFHESELTILPKEIVMNKINVGDTIRIGKKSPGSAIDDNKWNKIYLNKCGVVKEISNETYSHKVLLDGESFKTCFAVEELILLPKEVVVNKIKVGDRVIAGEKTPLSDMLQKDYDAGYKGRSGVVKGIFECVSMCFPYRVKLDGNNYNSHFHEDELTVLPKEDNKEEEKKMSEDKFFYVINDKNHYPPIKKFKIIAETAEHVVGLYKEGDKPISFYWSDIVNNVNDFVSNYWKNENV